MVWHDILSQINIVSKILQNISLILLECVKILRNIHPFLKDYRLNGFKQMLCLAKEIATELEIETEYGQISPIRIRRKIKQFTYEGRDTPTEDPLKKFEIEFFNVIIDVSMNSIEERFSHLENHCNIFEYITYHRLLTKNQRIFLKIVKICMVI